MTYPDYIRERARALRTSKHLSVDEIAERLVVPKTTVYAWIRDLPLGRPRRATAGQRKGNESMQAKYRHLREGAYAQGAAEYDELVALPTFRDFVVLYIAEGYKRSRHTASICNSDPTVLVLAARWLRQLSGRSPTVRVQYHADQDIEELRAFWAATLDLAPQSVRLHPKSNTSKLKNLLTQPWVFHRPGRGGQRPPRESIASAITAQGEW